MFSGGNVVLYTFLRCYILICTLLIEFEKLPSYSNTKKEIFPKIIIDVHLMRVIAKIIFDPYVGP